MSAATRACAFNASSPAAERSTIARLVPDRRVTPDRKPPLVPATITIGNRNPLGRVHRHDVHRVHAVLRKNRLGHACVLLALGGHPVEVA